MAQNYKNVRVSLVIFKKGTFFILLTKKSFFFNKKKRARNTGVHRNILNLYIHEYKVEYGEVRHTVCFIKMKNYTTC